MLKPAFSHNFGGAIWRLEIDELTNILVVEVRNETDKQVSFSSVDLNTGRLNFENYKTDERWLTGIEGVYKNVALLHYYKHESSPEHKSIIAINATTGAGLWSNYSYAFDQLTINGPAVYHTGLQPKKLLLADVETGAMVRGYNSSDKPLLNSIVIPSITAASNFAAGDLALQPVGNILHYHHHNNYRIVSLHALKNGVLQQHLFIMDGADVLYADLLNTGIQKMQPEAFVLHKNALVYIKNKTELTALHL